MSSRGLSAMHTAPAAPSFMALRGSAQWTPSRHGWPAAPEADRQGLSSGPPCKQPKPWRHQNQIISKRMRGTEQ